MEEKVHVAYMRENLADDYNRHTAASIASVLEHCSKPVVVHIFHEEKLSSQNPEAAEDNVSKYRQLVAKYSAEIEFHNFVIPMCDYPKIINSVKKNSRFPIILFGRLYFTHYLKDIKYVISLGSDIIVKNDLSIILDKLQTSNLGISGCLDNDMLYSASDINTKIGKYLNNYWDSIGFKNKKIYFNTDFIILNLEFVRKTSCLPGNALNILEKVKELEYPDQDIYNIVFQDCINILENRYNLFVYFDEIDRLIDMYKKEGTGYILHYSGDHKPWKGYFSKYDIEYWYYLSKTPWGEDGRVFSYMQQIITTQDNAVEHIDSYVWEKPLRQKISLFWTLSGSLYLKILRRYYNQYFRER